MWRCRGPLDRTRPGSITAGRATTAPITGLTTGRTTLRSFYYPYYGYPYYGGFYGSFGWGFGIGYGFGYPYAYGYPYYGFGYGYGQYPYPYYGPIVYDYSGSARLQVTPRNTQVYIDGYFVGVVDSFDGNLQRLHVEAGEHELQLYLEGHRTFTQKVLFPRGGTLTVTHVMQPLGPGESAVPPPKPDESMRATPSNSVSARRQGPRRARASNPSSDPCCSVSGPPTPTSSSTASCGRRQRVRISSSSS